MLVEVCTLNQHKFQGQRYDIGQRYLAPKSALPWLTSNNLAVQRAELDELWLRTEGSVLTPPEIRATHKAKWSRTAKLPHVLQLCQYDPGAAAYRYHSALNASGFARSTFVRWGHSNPHCDLRQYDGEEDLGTVERLFYSADIVLFHIDYRPLTHELCRTLLPHQRVIRLYHGSVEPGRRSVLVQHEEDERMRAVQLGARLYHQRLSPRMHWLPIPIPVRDYKPRKVASRDDGTTLRVAHSPTRREIKGTSVLLNVVQLLQDKGYDIELDLIEGCSHGEALLRKQAAHVTFDSFWLGLQGSGLEAAAMGQMVVAGDTNARDDYMKEFGYTPYTFANDAEQLELTLARAYNDESWRLREAQRAHSYVKDVHTYDAVGKAFVRALHAEGMIHGAP